MSEGLVGKSIFEKIDELLDKVDPTTTDQKLDKANVLALKAIATHIGGLARAIDGLAIKLESSKSIH